MVNFRRLWDILATVDKLYYSSKITKVQLGQIYDLKYYDLYLYLIFFMHAILYVCSLLILRKFLVIRIRASGWSFIAFGPRNDHRQFCSENRDLPAKLPGLSSGRSSKNPFRRIGSNQRKQILLLPGSVKENCFFQKMIWLISERLERGYCDDVLEVAWSTMWNVTDETPANCRKFLENNGMEYFLSCLNVGF